MKLLIKYVLLNLLIISACFAQDSTDISGISLESLLNIRINTASKYLQTSTEAPASVTIVTAEDIKNFGFQTLDEIMRSVRGYYISNDRNYSYLGIRGFSRPTDYNNRILIQLNGHTLNENVFGSAFIEAALGVNLDAVERIEIVRGPGSAIYGTGAMFSVINVITRNGEQEDSYNASVTTGSYGRIQGGFSVGKKLHNGLDLSVSGTLGEVDGQDHYYEDLDTPENNYGISIGMDWEKFIGLQSRLKYKDLSFQVMHTYRRKAIPTGSYNAVLSEINQSDDGNTFLELQYQNDVAFDKELTIKGYYQDYIYKGAYFIDELGFDATNNRWFGGEAQLQWDLIANNRIAAGVEYKNQIIADYRMWSEDNIYFNGDFPHSSFSIYITDQWSVLKNLDIHLGLRYDHYSEIGSYVVPRLAAIYNPFNSTTVKLIYGKAFRRPSVYEFYYEDPGIQKSNPNLASENIKTTELIFEQKISKEFLALLSIYQNYITDLIDPVIDPVDSMIQFRNISKVNSGGVELEFNYFPCSQIKFFGSYVYQVSKNDITKLSISNSPARIAKFGAAIPLFTFITAGLDFYYESPRKTIVGTETDPFLLANINLTSFKLFDLLTLALKINNVLNTGYFSPAGFEHIQDKIRQDGRNYSLTLRIGF